MTENSIVQQFDAIQTDFINFEAKISLIFFGQDYTKTATVQAIPSHRVVVAMVVIQLYKIRGHIRGFGHHGL